MVKSIRVLAVSLSIAAADTSASASVFRGRALMEDEDCADGGPCHREETAKMTLENSCNYHVKAGQVFTVKEPVLIETNIEAQCPIAEHTSLHHKACKICASKNCGTDMQVACGGCCGDQLHDREFLNLTQLKSHHTCEDVKRAFNSSFQVDCDGEGEPGGNVSVVFEEANYSSEEDDYLNGTISTECEITGHRITCEKVPVLLEFQCDDCTNKGSRSLLRKCCEACKKWVNGLDRDPGIPQNVAAFGSCSGCTVENVIATDSDTPSLPPIPWSERENYMYYTKEHAVQKYNEYIENHICPNFQKPCTAFDRPYKKDECMAGNCSQSSSESRRLQACEDNADNSSVGSRQQSKIDFRQSENYLVEIAESKSTTSNATWQSLLGKEKMLHAASTQGLSVEGILGLAACVLLIA